MTVINYWKRLVQPCFAGVAEVLRRGSRAYHRHRAIKNGLLIIGKLSYGYPRIIDSGGSKGRVIIGNYCSIADGVKILTGGNHHPNGLPHSQFASFVICLINFEMVSLIQKEMLLLVPMFGSVKMRLYCRASKSAMVQ
jgi:hypothetical protein